MQIKKYIYSFSYDNTERELSNLESRCIFDVEEKNKLIFSDKEIDPSSSAFIKNRIDVISFSEDYTTLINKITKEGISIDGFKVEYLVFQGDTTGYSDRLDKLRDIGFSIEGIAEYYCPNIIYALCYYKGIWYFGTLIKNNFEWQKHNQKPFSYSNSIGVNIAKSLINISAKANKEIKLLDACCGVGTIMLEACFLGYNIEGCDINWKICRNARLNLSHFDYSAKIYRCDIKDISTRYDAAIIDLPYNLVSVATEDDVLHIIQSTSEITDRLVIVSTSDITNLINTVGFRISEFCNVSKKGKSNFTRKIWVCDRVNSSESLKTKYL